MVESEEEIEKVEENMETGPLPNPEEEEIPETGPSSKSEARPLRRSPRVKTAKNVKFVKSANIQEEGIYI